ncbi:CD3324 family protein [uncultured Acetatifactor sp.]|jgi:Mor family transcriptional regulator|uniref:CD3324 family protein n=1 Tax=uncultured Acetatifactor sp. TaxID=1671927 RepID=UPI00261B91D9|nr:CD3324 family protein [uncultured Acetatifactor sp.]
MGYIRAEEILPVEVIELIQQYVDGKNIYIPRKLAHRQGWGTGTQIKQELLVRNQQIYRDYLAGSKIPELACKYYLSKKSIQRIIKELSTTVPVVK